MVFIFVDNILFYIYAINYRQLWRVSKMITFFISANIISVYNCLFIASHIVMIILLPSTFMYIQKLAIQNNHSKSIV